MKNLKDGKKNDVLVNNEGMFEALVGEEVRNYMEYRRHIGDSWAVNNGYDIESERLAKFLNNVFPKGNFIVNSSQSVFDIISVPYKLAIELKGTKTKSRKILTNGSIIPYKINAKYAIPKSKEYEVLKDTRYNSVYEVGNLNVIMVVVRYSGDHRYIDGVEVIRTELSQELFVSCHKFFETLNKKDVLKKVMGICKKDMVKHGVPTDFPDGYIDGTMTDVEVKLRKLLSQILPSGE